MMKLYDETKGYVKLRGMILLLCILLIITAFTGCASQNERRNSGSMFDETLETMEEPLRIFYDGTGHFLLKSFQDAHPEIDIRLINCLPETDNGFDEFDLNKIIEDYGIPDLIIARDELSIYLSEMFKEGHIADLTDFCSNDISIDSDDYFPGTFDVFNTEEELYALPLGITMDFMLIAESKYSNSAFAKLEEGYTGRELLNVLLEEVHKEKETGEFFSENNLSSLLFMHYLDGVTQTDAGIQMDEDLFKQVYDFNYHVEKEADEAIEFWNEQGDLYERDLGYAKFSAIEPRRYEGSFTGSIWNVGDAPAVVLSYAETAYQYHTEEGIKAVYFPTADDGNKYQAKVKLWGAVSEKSNRKQLAYDFLRMLMDEDIDSFGALWGMDVPEGASILNVNVYPIRIENALSLLDRFEVYSTQLIYGNHEDPIEILDRVNVSDSEKEKHANVLKSIAGLYCCAVEISATDDIFNDYFKANVTDYENCYFDMLNMLNEERFTSVISDIDDRESGEEEKPKVIRNESDETEEVKELKEKIRNTEIGETIFLGETEQDNNLENGTEPIEWIVLEKTDNEAYVISKKVLEWLTFSEYKDKIEVDGEKVTVPYNYFTWDIEKNQQRAWLTNVLYAEGFNEVEKEIILLTRQETPSAGYFTFEDEFDDYLYIPSKEEVELYMADNRLRQAEMTVYVAKKANQEEEKFVRWSLRTKMKDSQKYTMQITENGEYGATYTSIQNGVRPVMWLDIS